jgi:hypothetical protein
LISKSFKILQKNGVKIHFIWFFSFLQALLLFLRAGELLSTLPLALSATRQANNSFAIFSGTIQYQNHETFLSDGTYKLCKILLAWQVRCSFNILCWNTICLCYYGTLLGKAMFYSDKKSKRILGNYSNFKDSSLIVCTWCVICIWTT